MRASYRNRLQCEKEKEGKLNKIVLEGLLCLPDYFVKV